MNLPAPLRRLLRPAWRCLAPDWIVQRTIAGTRFWMSLRDHYFWLAYGDAAATEKIPFPTNAVVWDLGCNIGIHSVAAARAGNQVLAFDISFLNIWCLQHTAAAAQLNIRAYHTPVTVGCTEWTPAPTGGTEEEMTTGGRLWSLDYMTAGFTYGLPNFIKVDIQGGEREFLQSDEFRAWITRHKITLFVETHDDNARHLWPGFRQIDGDHYILEWPKQEKAPGRACRDCGQALTPAPAWRDGEETTVGYRACSCSRTAWLASEEANWGVSYEEYREEILKKRA